MFEKYPVILITIGSILAIVGVILTIVMFFFAVGDGNPAKDAEWEGHFNAGGEQQSADLDAGDYDVWCEAVEDPGEVTIKDGSGNVIFRDTMQGGDSITINDVEYRKLGEFKAKSSGSYTVETEQSGTVYITPPIDIFGGIAIACSAGCVTLLIGLGLVAVGYLTWARRDRIIHPGPGYPPPGPGYPSPGPSYPPPRRGFPSQPRSSHPLPKPKRKPTCPSCGGEPAFVDEYDDWYCKNCEQYLSEGSE